MTGRHVLLLALGLLAFAGAKHAFAQADAFEQAECQETFAKLREDVERHGQRLQSAQGKATAQQACQMLRNFTAAESRMLKFMTDRQQACGIPGEIITQVKSGHGKAVAMRNEVCKVAAAPQAPPPPPPSQGLSGALGTPSFGGPPGESTGGGGVFDTLTGNVLNR